MNTIPIDELILCLATQEQAEKLNSLAEGYHIGEVKEALLVRAQMNGLVTVEDSIIFNTEAGNQAVKNAYGMVFK